MRHQFAVLIVALMLGAAAPAAAQDVGARRWSPMGERVELRRMERIHARRVHQQRAHRLHLARLHRRAHLRAERMRLRMLHRAPRWERRI